MDNHKQNSSEWVKVLKENNLKITDQPKFEWYIDNFNYYNFIKSYNRFFILNSDISLNTYKDNVSSSMIISLFNFDRNVSSIILGDLLSLERKLSTAICNEIIRKNHKRIPKLKEGLFISLEDEDIYTIFPKLKTNIQQNPKLFKKYENNEAKYFKEKFSQKEKKPLWYFVLELTFGDLVEIFCFLSETSQKKITCLFLKDKKYDKCYFDFRSTLKLINHARNMLCHNSAIYDITYTNYKHRKNIINLYSKIFNEKITNIKLFNLIKLIEWLTPHNSKLYDISIEKFDYHFKKINIEILEEIKLFTNFK